VRSRCRCCEGTVIIALLALCHPPRCLARKLRQMLPLHGGNDYGANLNPLFTTSVLLAVFRSRCSMPRSNPALARRGATMPVSHGSCSPMGAAMTGRRHVEARVTHDRVSSLRRPMALPVLAVACMLMLHHLPLARASCAEIDDLDLERGT
jgi:hypothetical protein